MQPMKGCHYFVLRVKPGLPEVCFSQCSCSALSYQQTLLARLHEDDLFPCLVPPQAADYNCLLYGEDIL